MANERNYSKLTLEELILEEKKHKTVQIYGKAVCIVASIFAVCMLFIKSTSSIYILQSLFSIILAVISIASNTKILKIIQSEIQNKSTR